MNIDTFEPEMPDGPIGGETAWKGANLRDDDRWIHRLDENDVAELEAAAEAVAKAGVDLLAVSKQHFPLPGLAPKIAELRRDVMERYGFGYLRGLPVHRYDLERRQIIYWGLSRHLGDPVPQNRNGHMLGHVIDLGDSVDALNKRLTQTNAELAFHSDGCDIVGLLCCHTARAGGESALVSAIAVHDEMMRRSPEHARALYRPVLIDRRGEVPAGKNPWLLMPVFMYRDGVFNAYAPLKTYVESARRFDGAPKMTPLQDEAFALFLSICTDEDFALRIPFEPGDMQFVHNHLVFHSRTAYEDFPEFERKRHLIRIWLSAPDGRELHPVLAERWVNIERGTVRGGVNIPERRPLCIPPNPATPAFS